MVQRFPLPLLRRWTLFALQQSLALPLGLLFLGLVALLSPVGEFPLSDDWIYSKTVQHLLQTGHYQAHPYLNATLVAQAYWGAFFCKVFGFSFTALRISTLVLAFVHAWAVAKCGRELGFSRTLALLCGGLVATSPLMLQLSYSFMTDVPFLAFSTLAGYCFLKALRQPKPQIVALGSGFSVLAFLVRQFGILTPAAFGFTLLLLQGRKGYVWSKAIVAALIVPWVVVVGLYLIWGNALKSETPILDNHFSIISSFVDGLRHFPVALCYLGLFCLPLALSWGWQMVRGGDHWTRQRWLLWAAFCGVSGIVFWLPQGLYWLGKLVLQREDAWLLRYPVRMPLMIYKALLDLGLGPLQLPDPQFQPPLQLGDGWWLLTLAALWGGGLLFLCLVQSWGRGWNRPFLEPAQHNQARFLSLWAVISLAATYNPFRPVIVDRYFLAALVPCVLLLGLYLPRPRAASTLLPLVIGAVMVGVFSVASLQDYLAWNRAAWTAHRTLERHYHVPSALVQGIDTFNGWYNSDAYMERYNTRNWWQAAQTGSSPWVLDNQYVVASTEPRPGYRVLTRVPYVSWLGGKERAVVIFQRLDIQGGKPTVENKN